MPAESVATSYDGQRRMLPSDVQEYDGATTSFQGSTSQTNRTLTFLHVPTGLEVSGLVPPGHFTRSEMRAMLQQLRGRLWLQLEQLVAEKLGTQPHTP